MANDPPPPTTIKSLQYLHASYAAWIIVQVIILGTIRDIVSVKVLGVFGIIVTVSAWVIVSMWCSNVPLTLRWLKAEWHWVHIIVLRDFIAIHSAAILFATAMLTSAICLSNSPVGVALSVMLLCAVVSGCTFASLLTIEQTPKPMNGEFQYASQKKFDFDDDSRDDTVVLTVE